MAAFDSTPDCVEDDEVQDLIILRDRFGLSARDVYQVLPAWEVELLLSAVRRDDDSEGEAGPVADPWESPPDLPI